MNFISVRQLSLKPSQIWRALKEGKDYIITSNGKPIAILTGVNEENLESSLKTVKQTRAMIAMQNMQESSVKAGLDKMTMNEIEEEIKTVRKTRNEGSS